MQIPKPSNAIPETKVTDFSGKHILITDDEPINMMITSKMLLARKAKISKANNGYELLQLLDDGLEPDLILLDIKMPELDGLSAIKKIKQQYPHLVVLAFTASFIDEETETFLRENGFYASLSKAFKPAEFYSTIAEALEGTL